jgi:hypothetical protein
MRTIATFDVWVSVTKLAELVGCMSALIPPNDNIAKYVLEKM